MLKIAVASGKGGTGKTTISTNLAMLLAQNRDVILADLDVEEPNAGLYIHGNLNHSEGKFRMVPDWLADNCIRCGNCQTVCNFHAVIQIAESIMVLPQLCHSCYACSELCPSGALPMRPEKMGELRVFLAGSLSFVESRLEIGQEQAVPLISQSLQYISEHFPDKELLILDSPPGTSCPVIESVKTADVVILVTEPTPFGLHDLKLAVETMRKLEKSFAVIINRFGVGNNDVENYTLQENIPVIAKFPNDQRIASLYSQGKLVYDSVLEFRRELEKVVNFIDNYNEIGAG